MKRRTWLVAAGLVVTAGFGALWQHERVESWLTGLGLLQAKALRCEPDVGLRASYRIRMHTQIKLNAASLLSDARKQKQGELITTDAGFSGRLRLQALEERKLGVLVGLTLDELEVDSGVADLPAELRQQMGQPFYAVLAPDCSFRDFGFAENASAEIVNRLQGLLQGFSLALDADGSKLKWQSSEYDSVGQYSANYERPDLPSRRVTKRRMTYLRAHPASGFGIKEPMRVRVIKSEAPAQLDEEAAWLQHLESREHLVVTRSNGSMVADLKLSLWLERSQEDASDMALVNAPAGVKWRKQTDAPLVAEPRRPDPPDFMKVLPLDAALSQYAEMMRSGGKNSIAKAADFLAMYLRARPEMAQEIMKLLAQQVIPKDLEATIFLALEMAGTKESHDALISGLSQDHTSANRSRAAAALPDIPKPEPRTLDALRETARTAVAESPDETRLVRNSASFAIGTLERRTRVSYPALAKQAVAEMRSSLSTARGDQAQAVALDAIANSGNAELLTDVKPLLAAPEGLVRAHAIEAMGSMPPEANQDMFGPLIANEQDPRIRGTIAATYADQAKRADQPPPPLVVNGAIGQLGREQDPRVRGLLIDLIGPACAKSPQAMQALSNQFKHETDPMLLKLIGKWVPADQLGT